MLRGQGRNHELHRSTPRHLRRSWSHGLGQPRYQPANPPPNQLWGGVRVVGTTTRSSIGPKKRMGRKRATRRSVKCTPWGQPCQDLAARRKDQALEHRIGVRREGRRDGPKAKERGTGKTVFQGECHWCSQWGHSTSRPRLKGEYMYDLRKQGKFQRPDLQHGRGTAFPRSSRMVIWDVLKG